MATVILHFSTSNFSIDERVNKLSADIGLTKGQIIELAIANLELTSHEHLEPMVEKLRKRQQL